MMDSMIVDIPTDWLYRGKKKQSKAKAGKTVGNGGQNDTGKTEASGSGETVETGNGPNATISENTDKEGPRMVLRNRSASITNGTLSKTNSKAVKVVQRSSSTSKTQGQSSVLQKPKPRRLSESSSDLKKGDSLNERSRRSLFGSLFGKKSSSPQPQQPRVQQQQQQQQQQQHGSSVRHSEEQNSFNTVLDGVQTSIGSIGALKEPTSPEVRPHMPVTVSENEGQHKPSEPIPLEELAKIPMKRVIFAVDKFDCDPPQQLPSRKPKIGNVLVPEDMISDIPPISLGITNGGNATRPQEQTKSQQQITTVPQKDLKLTKDSKEYKMALEDYRRALKESIKHQEEAHYAAKRIESEVASFKTGNSLSRVISPRTGQKVEPEPTTTVVDNKIASLSIDKPIHLHENHFNVDPSDNGNSKSSEKAETTLDIIYTRCCHLREILPIPSTLRQVKGKTAPLHMLKFLNPKPTLIDILSFCDFISVVPINVVIFDKVSLTPEMFKIVLMSLVHSQVLEKLSLRNVPIHQEGWKWLCKYLMTNKSITRLDISQTKIRPDLPLELHRDNMDWSLFSQVLTKRSGKPLEELLVNGIKFRNLPVEQFETLLNSFAAGNTKTPLRLGVATSDINSECIKILFNWISKYKVQGVDLAFNDLSELIKPMVSKLSALKFEHLEYFTLNNTNISSAYDLALLLKYLSALPSLKFLDLSNLSQAFPDILPYMFKYLPRFTKLNRIHLDNNNLSFKNMSMLCSILSKCKNLTHISIQTQDPIYDPFTTDSNVSPSSEDIERLKTFSRNTFSAALYALVKDSPNLVILDVDYDNISDDIKSRIALMLMRNMNKNIDSNFQIDELSTQDELIFDGSLITESAEEVLMRLNNKEMLKTDPTKRYLTKKYCEKLQNLHHKVQYKIDDMFEKRNSGELPLQEKENLLRLLLLEKNLTNILEIYSNIPHLSQILGASSTNLAFLKHVSSETGISTPTTAEHEIAARPHLMATDSGRVIDVITGKSLLVDPPSNISRVGGRRQEEEEGELHKWGFFVQQQRSIYPEHESRAVDANSSPSSSLKDDNTSSTEKVSQPIILPKIPSGAELREAIIQAKGIDSISDLIQNVNKEQVVLESIYGNSLRSSGSIMRQSLDTKSSSANSSIDSPRSTAVDSQSSLTNNNKDSEDETVKETYEKILNNLKNERPLKTDQQPKK